MVPTKPGIEANRQVRTLLLGAARQDQGWGALLGQVPDPGIGQLGELEHARLATCRGVSQGQVGCGSPRSIGVDRVDGHGADHRFERHR